MEADRCRTDAQACNGCMTKLAILASAVRVVSIPGLSNDK
jgi:hypothetical protein